MTALAGVATKHNGGNMRDLRMIPLSSAAVLTLAKHEHGRVSASRRCSRY